MRNPIRACLLLAVAAAMVLGGCSTGDTTGFCSGVTTASTERLRFAASPNTAVRVITSPDANKLCNADMGIKLRYEDDSWARDKAPQNIQVEFAVEDGSGGPATIFDLEEPEFTTEYGRRYIKWTVQASAGHREDPVNYFIRIGTNADGDRPVLAWASIRYTPY